MTADQLYKTTLAIMSENKNNSSSYAEFVIPNINFLLAELIDEENALRQSQGIELLTSAPQITVLEDTVPYQEQLVRVVMPYGLALYLAMGDDEYAKAGFYDSRYQMARAKYAKASYVGIEDHYSEYYDDTE